MGLAAARDQTGPTHRSPLTAQIPASETERLRTPRVNRLHRAWKDDQRPKIKIRKSGATLIV